VAGCERITGNSAVASGRPKMGLLAILTARPSTAVTQESQIPPIRARGEHPQCRFRNKRKASKSSS
jgi:hypothetical protein